MSVETVIGPEYKEINRNGWSLVYNPKFKEYRESYKNIISKVKEALDGGEVEGFKSEMLKHTSGGKTYFTLEVNGEKFFIKKIPENHKQGGVNEFKSTEEAKQRLFEAGIDRVKLVDYMFAYTGNEFRFVVSKYDVRLNNTLASYMDECLKNNRLKELHDLDDRFADLKNIFKDYYDFKVENMAYYKETDEIILFDLNKYENALVDSPDEGL